MKKKVEIEESEDVLFDLDEEESSSEEDEVEDEVEDEEKFDLVGSENMRSNLMTGGIVAVLLAIGVFVSKKFLGKSQTTEEGGSNYDPVNFEF